MPAIILTNNVGVYQEGEYSMFRKRNQKGFTLAELLIVVAIIAVLVAIAIPIFASQLEKSKQATDAANIRAAYAEASVATLDKNANCYKKSVQMTQSNGNFDKIDADTTVGGVKLSGLTGFTKGNYAYVGVPANGGNAVIQTSAPSGYTDVDASTTTP